MKLSPTRLAPLALLLVACGSPPEATTPAAGSPSVAATAAPTAPASVDPARDPKVAALVAGALPCAKNDEYHSFDRDCAGFKAWDAARDTLTTGELDGSLFSLWNDPDPNVRALVQPVQIHPAFWQDAGHAKALFALAKKEPSSDLLRRLADYVAAIDAEKLGLTAEVKELAHHPSKDFRAELALYELLNTQTPFALELTRVLLEDAERDVKNHALAALVGDGVGPSDAVCKLIAAQLARPDDLRVRGLEIAAASKCPGLPARAVAEIDKLSAKPTKETEGYALAGAADRGCRNPTSDPQTKAKAIAIEKRLAAAVDLIPMDREAAIDAIARCDKDAALRILPAFTKDPKVGEKAKSALKWVQESKAGK